MALGASPAPPTTFPLPKISALITFMFLSTKIDEVIKKVTVLPCILTETLHLQSFQVLKETLRHLLSDIL